MAILWQKNHNGALYQVRTAVNCRRLYKDGVLLSAYNPSLAVTANAWDLLMLPAFFYPDDKIQNILLLGVGGGSVIHMLNRYVKPGKITGIEFDQTQLAIGKRFFGLSQPNVDLIHADAITWLETYQGPAFDMIIDDLFVENLGEPVASSKADSKWFTLLLKKLKTDGVIVKNFIEKNSLVQSAPVTNKSLANRFKSKFIFSHPYNENVIGAFLKISADSNYLRKRLVANQDLNPLKKTSRLRYRLRKLNT